MGASTKISKEAWGARGGRLERPQTPPRGRGVRCRGEPKLRGGRWAGSVTVTWKAAGCGRASLIAAHGLQPAGHGAGLPEPRRSHLSPRAQMLDVALRNQTFSQLGFALPLVPSLSPRLHSSPAERRPALVTLSHPVSSGLSQRQPLRCSSPGLAVGGVLAGGLRGALLWDVSALLPGEPGGAGVWRKTSGHSGALLHHVKGRLRT